MTEAQNMKHIFLADDNAEVLDSLRELFVMAGVRVTTFSSPEDVIVTLAFAPGMKPSIPVPDAVVTDYDFGPATLLDGLDVIEIIQRSHPDLPIALLSGQSAKIMQTELDKRGLKNVLVFTKGIALPVEIVRVLFGGK